MVKCIFEDYSTQKCFGASTMDTDFIKSLYEQINSTNWVIGLLRKGTVDNICDTIERTWHYETFTGFAPYTIEECQTTIDQVEQYPEIWLNRSSSSCISATLINIVECIDISCNLEVI